MTLAFVQLLFHQGGVGWKQGLSVAPPPLPLPSAPSSLQEMIYQEPRETLAAALISLKEAIPELSVAMQNFIRDKRSAELKVYLVKTLDTPCMHVVNLTCILRILSSRLWSYFY